LVSHLQETLRRTLEGNRHGEMSKAH